jgi:hypothetical protein
VNAAVTPGNRSYGAVSGPGSSKTVRRVAAGEWGLLVNKSSRQVGSSLWRKSIRAAAICG